MSEHKNEIRNKIKEILSNNEDFSKKALQIFQLSKNLSPQVGIEFLNIYSEMFNESHVERMSNANISRIMIECIPSNIVKFLNFVKEDPQRLVEFADATKKFISSFPYSYTEVMNIYHIPVINASYFFNNQNSLKTFEKMPLIISDKSYAIMISAAIISKRDDVLLNMVNDAPAVFLSDDLVFELIDSGIYNWDIISSIINKIKLNINNPVKYENGFAEYFMTLPLFVACKTIVGADKDCFTLLEKIQENYGLSYSTKSYIKAEKKSTNVSLNFIDFLNNFKAGENYDKVISIIIDNKNLTLDTYFTIINTLLNNDKIKYILSLSTINKILDHELINDISINKYDIFELITKNLINLSSSTNDISEMRVERMMFEKIQIKFPEDMKKINFFRIWVETSHRDFPYNENLKYWVKKDMLDNIENIKENNRTNVLNKYNNHIYNDHIYHDHMKEYIKFYIEHGFIKEVITEKKEGMFFNRKTVVEKTLVWDDEGLKNHKKTIENKKETYSFLTSDSGESMKLNLIKTLPNKQLQSIAENLVMISYQFSSFSNDPLFSITEESHFLKNNLPKMFNKIIEHYHEFKIFDEKSANDSINAQLIMLQKKTTQCMNNIVNDMHYDLLSEVKVNDLLIKSTLTANSRP